MLKGKKKKFSCFILYMMINSFNKVNFGAKVPTEPLLKSALGLHMFEDAKILNNSVGVTVSGHISFYNRASKIAQNIIEKNPQIEKLISEIKIQISKEEQLKQINQYVKKYGDTIDVVV